MMVRQLWYLKWGWPVVRRLKVRRVGRSVGVTLPKEKTDRLNIQAGGSVLAVETEGDLLLTPHDARLEETLRIATEVTRTYRSALRRLAK